MASSTSVGSRPSSSTTAANSSSVMPSWRCSGGAVIAAEPTGGAPTTRRSGAVRPTRAAPFATMRALEYDVLRSLSPEQQREVLAATVRRRYARDEVVFHEGDLGDSLCLVAKGR